MPVVSRRIFDTDSALKGSFNGLLGRWQLITYGFFAFGYAIIAGWISNLHDFTLLNPEWVDCNESSSLKDANMTMLQRLNHRSKNFTLPDGTTIQAARFNMSRKLGDTVITQFEIFCDLEPLAKAPRFSHYFGFFIGSFILGFASDRGGRKMIILACIWTTGVMSLFQLVGHDFISYVFFQFFIGIFTGGVYSTFLPTILEMFPISFRTFYGVFFHIIICLFELLMPWLSKSFKSWQLLQIFVTAPLIITSVMQWIAYESIFWFLAHKEYDKAIKVLTQLAKRNGINFESKFKEAREFLHAKHSKATQVDILPLLRLQDIDALGKKYPQVDMAELQKQKSNNSRVRRFLNSLKGANYRSTNTIYRPLDFVYSPPLLIYVLILAGLWLTNGLTESMESIKRKDMFSFYIQSTFSHLFCVLSSTLATALAIFKIGRRWMIFLAYLIMEICLLGSLIANINNKENDEQTEITLNFLYHLCKFSTHFGFIFLMLITAEVFPTSLRCTGMGLCFSIKMLGSLISSPNLMNYNENAHRLAYCILTLLFGSLVLFLPETKTFPLPRSILQIEAMPTAIGKKLRSRKVKMACEKRQLQLNEQHAYQSFRRDLTELKLDERGQSEDQNLLTHEKNQQSNQSTATSGKQQQQQHAATATTSSAVAPTTSNTTTKQQQNEKPSSTGASETASKDKSPSAGSPKGRGGGDKKDEQSDSNQGGSYDTVTSVHDIEQDDHQFYVNAALAAGNMPPLQAFFENASSKLGKIVEVPSKNITRNNSLSDLDHANSKV